LAKSAQRTIGCVKSFAVKWAHKCNFLHINATFVENKSNFLTFLLQQKLALVITDVRRALPDGGGIFPKDLVPCLSSKKVKTIFRKDKLTVLDRPGNSPDLKYIENL